MEPNLMRVMISENTRFFININNTKLLTDTGKIIPKGTNILIADPNYHIKILILNGRRVSALEVVWDESEDLVSLGYVLIEGFSPFNSVY